jgi:hypothetical protein
MRTWTQIMNAIGMVIIQFGELLRKDFYWQELKL